MYPAVTYYGQELAYGLCEKGPLLKKGRANDTWQKKTKERGRDILVVLAERMLQPVIQSEQYETAKCINAY